MFLNPFIYILLLLQMATKITISAFNLAQAVNDYNIQKVKDYSEIIEATFQYIDIIKASCATGIIKPEDKEMDRLMAIVAEAWAGIVR